MDWVKYQEIAKRFEHKSKREDREDLRQTIILRLAEVEVKYNGNGNSLTEWGMLRVASYTVLEYWRNILRTEKPVCLLSGIAKKPDYLKCSFSHKPDSCQKCCYRGMRPIVSLNDEIDDGDGNTVERWQTLADDKAIDLEAWLDAKIWQYRAPARLITIAHKKVNGLPLTETEQRYLRRQRQKSLNLMSDFSSVLALY